MAVNVIMPHMGESVIEGTVVAWLKKPGDRVEEDEPLVEIETDKINVEVPAPAKGVLLKVLAEEGATVLVEDTIAVIGEPGDERTESPAGPEVLEAPVEEEAAEAASVPEAAAVPAAKGPTVVAAEEQEPAEPVAEAVPGPGAAPVPPPAHTPGVLAGTGPVEPGTLAALASPTVRRLARGQGVDLGAVKGTGRGGRITRDDVEAHVRRESAEAAEPEPAAPGKRPPEVDDELIPLTPMRRAIAEHMVRSVREAPHVTTVAEVDMTEVAALREKWRDRFARQGVKLTYMAFVLNAVARSLTEHPELNATWGEKGVLVKYRIGLGIAVAVEGGLVVPVIRDADRLSLPDLARAVQALAEKTRQGKVAAANVAGGTFTITNPGVFGTVISTPIIHQPQSAILAMGRIGDVPAVIEGGICVRKRMFLSLSYDHRVVDGATAVRFLQRVRGILEGADFAGSPA